MKKYVFSMLYLSACGGMGQGEETSVKPEVELFQETPLIVVEQGTPNACLHAWGAVSKAWDDKLGLSPMCQHLDAAIDIVVVSAEKAPCPGAAGCLYGQTIYLLEGLSNTQAPRTAVHSWTHALALCETGDADANHENSALWLGDEGDTVESIASSAVPSGPCLGDK